MSGCGCDKRETEKAAGFSTIYLCIYLFMIYFTMLRVAHATQSNTRIIGD
jgi:hypothetical protein